MARSFADIRSEVLGQDFDAATWTSAAGRFVNEAIARVHRRLRLPTAEVALPISTVAGVATVSLPADFVRGMSLRNTTDTQDLRNVAVDQIDQSPASSGKPWAYAFAQNQLTLYPTPDAVYNLSLRYRRAGTQFVNDTDTTATIAFPAGDDYADVLVAYARSKLYRTQDDFEGAQFWQNEYETQLRMMAADLQDEFEDDTRQTPSMWAGRSGPLFSYPPGLVP